MFVPGTKKTLNAQTATYSLYISSEKRRSRKGRKRRRSTSWIRFGKATVVIRASVVGPARLESASASLSWEARREAGSQQQGQRRGIEKKTQVQKQEIPGKGGNFLTRISSPRSRVILVFEIIKLCTYGTFPQKYLGFSAVLLLSLPGLLPGSSVAYSGGGI